MVEGTESHEVQPAASGGAQAGGGWRVATFRWANEEGTAGLPYPEELEYLGYAKVTRHPLFYHSWLMRRVEDAL